MLFRQEWSVEERKEVERNEGKREINPIRVNRFCSFPSSDFSDIYSICGS